MTAFALLQDAPEHGDQCDRCDRPAAALIYIELDYRDPGTGEPVYDAGYLCQDCRHSIRTDYL